jgi:hypothetical protein
MAQRAFRTDQSIAAEFATRRRLAEAIWDHAAASRIFLPGPESI